MTPLENESLSQLCNRARETCETARQLRKEARETLDKALAYNAIVLARSHA